MKCIKAQRIITPFIKQELSLKDSEVFLKHIEKCDECKHELETYFMIYKGLDQLDSDSFQDNYNFTKNMNTYIRSVKFKIASSKFSRVIKGFTFIIVEALCALCIYTSYQTMQGKLTTEGIRRVWEITSSLPIHKRVPPPPPEPEVVPTIQELQIEAILEELTLQPEAFAYVKGEHHD